MERQNDTMIGQRIMIVGCGGSGKSTFAKNLGHQLNLPVVNLDQYYWQPGWVMSDPDSWTEMVKKLIREDFWIMDGNYGGTMDLRIARADTIIFLKYKAQTCLLRVLRRTFLYYGKTRPNMPENCPERFSPEFYHYILMYNRTRTPAILKKLNNLESSKSIFILSNDKEVADFLEFAQSRSKSLI